MNGSIRKLQRRLAYHEAGHALMVYILRLGRIKEISIRTRKGGRRLGWVTVGLSAKVDYLFLSRAMYLLAGPVAEYLYSGDSDNLFKRPELKEAKSCLRPRYNPAQAERAFNYCFDRVISLLGQPRHRAMIEKLVHFLLKKKQIKGNMVQKIISGQDRVKK